MVDNLLSVDERVGTCFRVTSDNGGPLEMRVVASGGAGAAIDVTRVLFVDAGVGGVGATGALNQPYATIQEAIDDAVASAVDSIVIKIAPGTYGETLLIPTSALTTVSFDGWTSAGPEVGNNNLPVLTGGMTVQPTPAPPISPEIFFSNLLLTGTVVGVGSNEIAFHLHNCRSIGSIQGGTLTVIATNSNIGGIINGTDDAALLFDGYSWGRLIDNGTSFGNVAKFFYDHGCDTAPGELAVTGLAIGASVEVQFPHPETLNNEYAIITKTGVPQTDYQLVFSHTGTAAVHAIITNLSRASTNFDDTVSTLVFHGTMPGFAP